MLGSKLIVPEKGEVAEKGLANIRNEALAKHNETTKQEYDSYPMNFFHFTVS